MQPRRHTGRHRTAVQNNGGGVYNHQLYFASMHKSNSVENHPQGEIAAKIAECFRFNVLEHELEEEAALGQFGSGYAWLVYDNGSLEIVKTPNQNIPPYTVKSLCYWLMFGNMHSVSWTIRTDATLILTASFL